MNGKRNENDTEFSIGARRPVFRRILAPSTGQLALLRYKMAGISFGAEPAPPLL
jgi:hypothetical protein